MCVHTVPIKHTFYQKKNDRRKRLLRSMGYIKKKYFLVVRQDYTWLRNGCYTIREYTLHGGHDTRSTRDRSTAHLAKMTSDDILDLTAFDLHCYK